MSEIWWAVLTPTEVMKWLDDNFIMGCARLEYTGKDTAKVMDTVGGVMYVEYKNGEVRECQK